MKYVFRNLISLLRQQKIMGLLMILCIFASVIIMHFSYGLYQNYNVVLENEDNPYSDMTVRVIDSEAVTKGAVMDVLLHLSDNIHENANLFLLMPQITPEGAPENVWLPMCRFAIRDGEVVNSPVLLENLSAFGYISGHYFTDADQTAGHSVAILEQLPAFSEQYQDITTRMEGDTRYITICGQEYQVVCYCSGISLDIPINSLPDSVPIQYSIHISFGDGDGNLITRRQYDEIKTAFETRFGEQIEVPELEIPEMRDRYFYQTILLISVLIALVAALNFSQLYQYILEQRQQRIAIFRLCGCTAWKAVGMFLMECAVMMLPVYLVAVLLFAYVLIPGFSGLFPYMAGAFSLPLYLALFGIYMAVSLCVLLGLLYGKVGRVSIVSLERRNAG